MHRGKLFTTRQYTIIACKNPSLYVRLRKVVTPEQINWPRLLKLNVRGDFYAHFGIADKFKSHVKLLLRVSKFLMFGF